jgi:hypothetical protein
MDGSGQPQGAPAEVDLSNEVEARTVYIWDPHRGVLLAAKGPGKGGGDISTMGFSMPMATHSSVDIQLAGAHSGDEGEAAKTDGSATEDDNPDGSDSAGGVQSP